MEKNGLFMHHAEEFFHQHHEIGDWVEAGESIGWIESEIGIVEVRTEISGVVRGIIQDGYEVTEHLRQQT